MQRHFDSDNGQPFHPKGNGNGYVLTFGDKRVYIAGDTENIPEMKKDAVGFYTRFGFEPIEILQGALADRPEPVAMFLPVATISSAL